MAISAKSLITGGGGDDGGGTIDGLGAEGTTQFLLLLLGLTIGDRFTTRSGVGLQTT